VPDSGITRKPQSVVKPEARFIERLKKGEETALEEVLKKHGPPVYKFLFRFLGDKKRTDAAFTEIMTAFVMAVPELGENNRVETVIWQEAHRTAVKTAFGASGPTAPRAGGKKTFPPPDYLVKSSDPAAQKLVAGWEELAPPYREALALSGIEPLLSYEEASGIIEGTQGTLRSRLSYALRRFMRDV